MRINLLQHTSNEGPGMITDWAATKGHKLYIYHPDQFGQLPTAAETDLLVILGGPMSPNDDLPWIRQEEQLIQKLLANKTPIFGVCFGAQLITKVLGYSVGKAPAKEVGWAPIYRQSELIAGIPEQLTVLHWHEEMFAIPNGAERFFASDRVQNQGFVLPQPQRVVGLQCHLEPAAINVREMVINDGTYLAGSALGQSSQEVLARPVPQENRQALFAILNYLAH